MKIKFCIISSLLSMVVLLGGCSMAKSKSEADSIAKNAMNEKYGQTFVATNSRVVKNSSMDFAALDLREVTGYFEDFEDITFIVYVYSNGGVSDTFPENKYAHDLLEYAGVKESKDLWVDYSVDITGNNDTLDTKTLGSLESYIEDMADCCFSSSFYFASSDENIAKDAAEKMKNAKDDFETTKKASMRVWAIILKDGHTIKEFEKLAEKTDGRLMTIERLVSQNKFNSSEIVDKYYMGACLRYADDWDYWMKEGTIEED